ncbi:MAG: LPP20 family lipoprotein [Salinibacter sp.]
MPTSVQQRVKLSPLRVLLLGSLLLVGGCSGGAVAQSGSPPDWFVNPNQAYDEAQYLLATASGPSAQAAQNRAFGNLARRFSAEIQASKELLDEYREVKKDGEVTSAQQKTVMITKSDVQSDQTLLNAEVLEQAKAGSKYYALVGMERQETLRIYAQRIKGNQEKIKDYRATARNTERPIIRLAALQKALVLAEANERLQRQRAIVAGGSGSATSSLRPELEKAVRKAQSKCPVAVQGDVPSSLRSQVGATLETNGFRTVDQPENAILKATVKYKEHPTLTGRDDAHFFRWTLAIKLTDTARNQTLETFTAEQRAGAPSKAGAKRRARNGARTTIEDEFSNFLKQTLLRINPS